jgi:hypothetical protein
MYLDDQRLDKAAEQKLLRRLPPNQNLNPPVLTLSRPNILLNKPRLGWGAACIFAAGWLIGELGIFTALLGIILGLVGLHVLRISPLKL